jgi:hypothetical protein
MNNPVAFLAESGDESSKFDRGASRLFVVGLVVFPDSEEAERCRSRIEELRSELKLPRHFELHFTRNRPEIRRAFLAAAAEHDFTYHAATLVKAESASAHVDLYLDAIARACALAGDAFGGAHLTVDMREVDRRARERMAAAIRRHVNAVVNRRARHKVVPRQSHADSLVQLADYVTGAWHWHEQQKRDSEVYRQLLRQREGQSIQEQL